MKFEEWLYEIENFSTRLERLMEEVDTTEGYGRLIKWLEAAYNVGLEEGRNNDS